jgi:hypothetical protein
MASFCEEQGKVGVSVSIGIRRRQEGGEAAAVGPATHHFESYPPVSLTVSADISQVHMWTARFSVRLDGKTTKLNDLSLLAIQTERAPVEPPPYPPGQYTFSGRHDGGVLPPLKEVGPHSALLKAIEVSDDGH